MKASNQELLENSLIAMVAESNKKPTGEELENLTARTKNVIAVTAALSVIESNRIKTEENEIRAAEVTNNRIKLVSGLVDNQVISKDFAIKLMSDKNALLHKPTA